METRNQSKALTHILTFIKDELLSPDRMCIALKPSQREQPLPIMFLILKRSGTKKCDKKANNVKSQQLNS